MVFGECHAHVDSRHRPRHSNDYTILFRLARNPPLDHSFYTKQSEAFVRAQGVQPAADIRHHKVVWDCQNVPVIHLSQRFVFRILQLKIIFNYIISQNKNSITFTRLGIR